MGDIHDYFYKIVLVGDSGVGKSCLLSRLTYNEFNVESKTTIGVDFATKSVIIDGKVVKVQIWDTAGQERFRAISRVFYNSALAAMIWDTAGQERFRAISRVFYNSALAAMIWDTAGQERFRAISRVFYNSALAAMVTYDVTNVKSFSNVTTWMKEVRGHTSEDVVLMMVGNKTDLRHLRVVNTEEGDEFARQNNMLFIETSALDSSNVEEAFNEVIRKVHRQMRVKHKVEEHAKEKLAREVIHLDDTDNKSSSSTTSTNATTCCNV